MVSDCEIRPIDVDELELVEPLWNALREHHASVTPHLGAPRPRAESWRRRRRQYEAWLAEPSSFALLAEREGAPTGYAMVRERDGSPTWPLSERAGEIETLAVLPAERGRGTGTALLRAVRERLAASDISEMSLLAISTNEDAIRFYERHGFGTHALWMSARITPVS